MGGASWLDYWSPQSYVVENAAPTNLIVTYAKKPNPDEMVAGNFAVSDNTISSITSDGTGLIYTFVLGTALVYGDTPTLTANGEVYNITNNVALTAQFIAYNDRVVTDGGIVNDAIKTNHAISVLIDTGEWDNITSFIVAYGGMKLRNSGGVDYVTKWYDVISATYDHVQANEALQPVYGANQINSINVVTASSSSLGFTRMAARTYIDIIKSTSTLIGNRLYDGYIINRIDNINYRDGSNNTQNLVVNKETRLDVLRLDGTSLSARRNRFDSVTDVGAKTIFPTAPTTYLNSATSYFAGDAALAIKSTVVLTQATIEAIEDYFLTEFAIEPMYSQATINETGSLVVAGGKTTVQDDMKRVLLSDEGEVNYYLDGYNKEGVDPSVTGTAETASAILKLKDTGVFASGVVAGQYVKNITTGKYHKILAVDSDDEVSLLYDLSSTDNKWGTSDSTSAGHLMDSTVDFEALGVTVGMIAFNRTDNTFATITNVATSDLTLDTDIFVDTDKWSVITDCFSVDDTFEVCTAIFDGSDGQVMVQIPKTYYKYDRAGTVITFAINDEPTTGFAVHPAFTPAGVEKDYIYVAAFEAGYESYYQGENQYPDDITGMKIKSLPGLQPVTYGHRWEMRQAAVTRGIGWHIRDVVTNHLIQLLFLTEYGAKNANNVNAIGSGFTDWTADNVPSTLYNNRHAASLTGLSLVNGNTTASLSKGDYYLGSYMSYRGIENFYGNINEFMDGVNIMGDSKLYTCNDPTKYGDSKVDDGYTYVADILTESNNIWKTLMDIENVFIPATFGTVEIFGNNYKHDPTGGEVILVTSGTNGYGTGAGFFTFSATTLLESSIYWDGTRIVFRG